jgi:hypothetical protein
MNGGIKKKGKEFVDATFNRYTGRLIVVFLIAFLALIYVFYDVFFSSKSFSANYKYYFKISASFVLLSIISSFIFLRRHYYIKAIVSDRGITFAGLLGKKYISWSEVTSFKAMDSILLGNIAHGKVANIQTSSGNYFFPLTMKEINDDHLKVIGKFNIINVVFQWEDSDGNRKDLTPENCPLYNEIKRHLGELRY